MNAADLLSASQVMFHIECWLGFDDATEYFSRHADRCHVCRDIAQNYATGTNLGAFANFDVTEDFSSGADEHPRADFGMAVALLIASTAQGDFVEDGDIVLNHCRLTNNNAGGVVDQDAAANLGRWMDVHGKGFRNQALQV